MDEARMTYCFCGCGTRVTNPRLAVTNANGWELSDELQQWIKLQIVWSRLSLELSEQLKRDIADGHHYWKRLREAIHTGERADTEDELHAAVWRKHAKKDRRKVRKKFRRDGLLDPFDFPDMDACELTAWITDGREPPWTAELDEAHDFDAADDDTDSDAFRLVSAALEHVKDNSWEWDAVPGAAIVQSADKLTNYREDFNLFLDAAALGFWIRTVERDVLGSINVVDPGYVEQTRRHLDSDPVEAITVSMTVIADGMPAPFALGDDEWNYLVDLANSVLESRARILLEQDDDFDDDADIGETMREFALKLGYGLAVTVQALGIDGTRPRQS